MKATKEKILKAALKRFNESGLVNVRLQHIADEAFISIGNLAYHFANKEAIVMGLYETLTKKQKDILAEYRIVPLFININRFISHTFELQKEYRFFYLDTLEIVRAYASIAEVHQNHIQFQINQLKSILDFNAARGAFIKEPRPQMYEHLALQIWMTLDFWLVQQFIRNPERAQKKDYESALWNLLIPFFTNTGKQEYEQMQQLPDDYNL